MRLVTLASTVLDLERWSIILYQSGFMSIQKSTIQIKIIQRQVSFVCIAIDFFVIENSMSCKTHSYIFSKVHLFKDKLSLFQCFPYPHLICTFFTFFLQGVPDMSNYTISFHFVPSKELYVLDFLIYGIKHAGVQALHIDKLD